MKQLDNAFEDVLYGSESELESDNDMEDTAQISKKSIPGRRKGPANSPSSPFV